jgi:hypothetical protein
MNTTTNLALNKSEIEQGILKDSNKNNKSNSNMLIIPRIKIYDTNKDGISAGNYVLVTSELNEKEERIQQVLDLGNTIDVVILFKTKSFNYWSESTNKWIAETNEFEEFSSDQIISLWENGKYTGDMSYPSFKQLRTTKYIGTRPDGSKENYLKYSETIYVLINGIVAKFKVNNTSLTGGSDYSFNDPKEKTLYDLISNQLQHFKCGVPYGVITTLKNNHEGKYYSTNFTVNRLCLQEELESNYIIKTKCLNALDEMLKIRKAYIAKPKDNITDYLNSDDITVTNRIETNVQKKIENNIPTYDNIFDNL